MIRSVDDRHRVPHPPAIHRRTNMVPGEYIFDGPDLELNANRPVVTISVNNTGDRPIQVGSHYHFFETNRALVFDREKAYGMRLDLPSGTSVRFEPGDVKDV